jgi:hypothetical protein
MKIVDNFFNKVVQELDSTYFPTVKYYRDNANCTKVHYATELFNNGCLTYDNYIKRLAKACNDKKTNIEKIINKYLIQD